MTITAPAFTAIFPASSWRWPGSRIGASLAAGPDGAQAGYHDGGGLSINVTSVAGVMHDPDQPNWNCRGCHHAWPCADARLQLRTQYTGNPGELSALLGTWMHRAAGDLPAVTPPQLFLRFLAWDRPPNHPPPHDTTG